MSESSFIRVANDASSRNDLVERGFTRRPLRIDVDIARSLEELAHAAWSIPRDKYYEGGDRYRSLNRVRAEIVEGGVKVWASEESTPYVQLKKYNTTIGGLPREYAPLPLTIAASMGVRKMIAHHLHYLPLSAEGTKYLVNVHVIRFVATPGRPCDTSPPGLHKDGKSILRRICWAAAALAAVKSSSPTTTNTNWSASRCAKPASVTSLTMIASGIC